MSASCDPDQSVKPGAPLLTKFSIVDTTNGTATEITADTAECATGVKAADACDPATDPALCKLGEADWCHCVADADDMTKGAWNCDPFSPLSVVVASFDRLLDTTPFEPVPADAEVTPVSDVAEVTATPPPPVTVGSSTDYSATGSETSIVFKVFGPFFGNQRSFGPSLQVMGAPAMAANATMSVTLDPTKILAKDGKTPFKGLGMLKDGSIAFKTAPFSASITVPAAMEMPPPAPEPDAGTDGGTDGGADGGAPDSGTDGHADGGATDAAAEGGVTDASISEGGVDASASADASDAKLDVVAEAGASDAAADAPMSMPPMPGEPVPADMNMAAVTIAFNNLIDTDTIGTHITVTEDGKPFTAYDVDVSGAPNIALKPKTEWAAGKTYVVTVDATVVDLVGDKLTPPPPVAFMMAAK